MNLDIHFRTHFLQSKEWSMLHSCSFGQWKCCLSSFMLINGYAICIRICNKWTSFHFQDNVLKLLSSEVSLGIAHNTNFIRRLARHRIKHGEVPLAPPRPVLHPPLLPPALLALHRVEEGGDGELVTARGLLSDGRGPDSFLKIKAYRRDSVSLLSKSCLCH